MQCTVRDFCTNREGGAGAAELLMGREDIDFSGQDDGFFQAGNFQVVVLDNGRVSASLESLLGSFDPDCPVQQRTRLVHGRTEAQRPRGCCPGR